MELRPLAPRLWRSLRSRTTLSSVFDSACYRRMSAPVTLSLPPRLEEMRELLMALALSLGCALQLFLVFPVIALFLASSVLGGTLSGLIISANASIIFAHERTTRRLELYSIAPAGGFAACWTIIVELMRKNRALAVINFFTRSFFTLAAIMGGGLLLVSLAVSLGDLREYGRMAAEIQSMALLLAALYLDYHLSVVTAVLVSLWIAPLTGGPLASGVSGGMMNGVTSFLTVQLGFFVVYGLIAITGMDLLFTVLRIESLLGLSVLRMLIYLLMREGLIRVLWGQVQHTLNTDTRELQQLSLRNKGI